MDLDAEKIMLALAETQKGYVREYLANYSEALVAVFRANGFSYLRFSTFNNWESKEAAYSAIVEQAKAEQATLVITVNNAKTARATDSYPLDDYEWGDLKPDSYPCILSTASGPGLKSCSLKIVFSIAEAKVHFEEPVWMFGSSSTYFLIDHSVLGYEH